MNELRVKVKNRVRKHMVNRGLILHILYAKYPYYMNVGDIMLDIDDSRIKTKDFMACIAYLDGAGLINIFDYYFGKNPLSHGWKKELNYSVSISLTVRGVNFNEGLTSKKGVKRFES